MHLSPRRAWLPRLPRLPRRPRRRRRSASL